jgi:aspartyl-tRNA(Asn)/glutamyl-tRNA(Gln) amidotransferase subunit A
MAWGAGQSEEKAAAAYARLRELAEAAPSAFEAVDAILAPTAPQTAFAFEEPAPANQADFTAWANFAGLPAAALCTGVSAEGLPLSIQIIAAKGEDARVLAIAQALEALFGRAPLPPAFRNS